jgi:hypothetical protein
MLLLGVVALLATTLNAQNKDEKKKADGAPSQEEVLKAVMRHGTPGPEHKRLDALVGSWTYTEKEWMEPGKDPIENKGTAERKWILGGRFLQDEVKGEAFGQPFTGLGLNGYDNILKKYVSTWVDSMSTSISTSEGTWDEKEKTINYRREGVDPVSGKKVKSHDIVRFLSDDKNMMEMYMEGPDGKETKVLEVIFTRKSK